MNAAIETINVSTPRDLVCDFKLAKRIKDLGLEIPTFFYYLYFPNTGKFFIYRNKTAFKTYDYNVQRGVECELIPAPLSEELVDALPEMHKTWWKAGADRRQKVWYCSAGEDKEIHLIIKSARKESSARAKMLVYLLENEMIKHAV